MRYLLTLLLMCGAGLAKAQATVVFPIDTGTPAKSVVVRIVDSSDGTPETGVTTADSPSFYYYEWGANANSSDFYTGDHTALNDAWDEGEIYHVGDGYYRVDVPDAMSDSEGTYTVHGSISGMVVIATTVQVSQAITVGSDGLAHSNVKKVNDTTQTAGDLAALITTLDTVADTIYTNMLKLGTTYDWTTDQGTKATTISEQ